MTNLTAKIFHDEAAAEAHIEASRWADGVYCPHCGSFNTMRMAGKTQAGMFLCRDCRDKFTCRTGTVMERSHIPLHKWLLALHLMASSKKGISALQLQRNLGLGSYKTAWFLAMRVREAMGLPVKGNGPLGGEGKTVEADATYVGGKEKNKHASKRKAGNIGGSGKQNPAAPSGISRFTVTADRKLEFGLVPVKENDIIQVHNDIVIATMKFYDLMQQVLSELPPFDDTNFRQSPGIVPIRPREIDTPPQEQEPRPQP